MASPAKTAGASPPAPADLYPQRGSVLGGCYRLDMVLGQGPSGVVYNGWHLGEHQAYAIKVLHPDLAALTAALVRLRHDNQAIQQLQHPHLGAARAAVGQDLPLLLRPLLHAESLRRRLLRGALPLPELAQLFAALCGAVEEAHRHGVVHGDLKPENILLLQRPGPLAPQIIDFGMCHLRDREGGIGSHPLLGTVSYLAPEQIQGDGAALDGRADVFALGALLYECLTGRVAFDGPHSSAVVARICLGDRPRPSATCPGLPVELDSVVARACHREPAERLPSPRALLAALLEALCGETAVAEALKELPSATSAPSPPPGEEAAAESAVPHDGVRWTASTVSLWPSRRQRPRRPSGAQAIQLFKELESARAQRPSAGSQELRRSAAEEAAQLIEDQRFTGAPPAAPAPIPEDERVTARLHSADTLRRPTAGAAEEVRPAPAPGAEPPARDDATPPRPPSGDHSALGPLVERARRSRPPGEPLPPVLGLIGRTAAGEEEAQPAPPAPAPPQEAEPRWLRPMPALLGGLLLLLLLVLLL